MIAMVSFAPTLSPQSSPAALTVTGCAVAPLPRVLAIGGFMGVMMMLDRPISVLSHQDEVILLMAALLLGELWANLELAPL